MLFQQHVDMKFCSHIFLTLTFRSTFGADFKNIAFLLLNTLSMMLVDIEKVHSVGNIKKIPKKRFLKA